MPPLYVILALAAISIFHCTLRVMYSMGRAFSVQPYDDLTLTSYTLYLQLTRLLYAAQIWLESLSSRLLP